VILEIQEDHLIIADNNKRGLPRIYPLSDINALWPRPVWRRAVNYLSFFCWLGSTVITITAVQQYRATPNLDNFSRMVIGASGMVLYSIPMFIKDKMPFSSGWTIVLQPDPTKH